jgi:hypothetical protein
LWSRSHFTVDDYAIALAEELTARAVTDLPIVFIGHSLGGILVKAALKFSAHAKAPRHRRLINKTAGVVFIATPHHGARIATMASRLPGSTKILKALRRAAPENEDIAKWYSQRAGDYGLWTSAYSERKPIGGVFIVEPDSADPRAPGCTPVPLDRDHLSIAHVESSEDGVFPGIVRDVIDWLERASRPSARISDGELDEIAMAVASAPGAQERANKVAAILRAAADRLALRRVSFAAAGDRLDILLNDFADVEALRLVDLAAVYPNVLAFRVARMPSLA